MEGDTEDLQDSSGDDIQATNYPRVVEDTLLDHMEICISECEKRETGALNYRDFYTVYLIETKVTDIHFTRVVSETAAVWRRYSEFEVMRNYLVETYPYLVIPPLPEKKFDTVDRGSEKRRGLLETFLLRCASHGALFRDRQLMGFLQLDMGWRDYIQETGYLAAAGERLKALSLLRAGSVDERFEAYRHYSSELRAGVQAVLRASSRAADRLRALHRLHATCARLLSEWSALEDKMGDSLQRAGHYLDTLSASVDAPLLEHEVLADQLKEYALAADSLRDVCAAQAGHQAAVERAQATLDADLQQRDALNRGESSLLSRLWGNVDTEETRETKSRALDVKIKESSLQVELSKRNLQEFGMLAQTDIERFQMQKVVDLRETLANFALLNVRMERKELQIWKQIRDCFEAIP